MTTKFLGREPAAIVGAIQAVLALLISFNALEFVGLDSQDDLALVVGVLGALAALYLALATSETLLAPVIEVAKASLALGVIYGLNISAEQTGLLIAVITAFLAGYQRDRTSPLDTLTLDTVRTPDPRSMTQVFNISEKAPVGEQYDDPSLDEAKAALHGGDGASAPIDTDPAMRRL